MKNKVYLIALLLSLAMTTILTSCSNNDPDKLIGDWQLEKQDFSREAYTFWAGPGFPRHYNPALDTTYYYDDENIILKFTDDGRVFYKGHESGTYYATENYINFQCDYHNFIENGDIEYNLTRNRLSFHKEWEHCDWGHCEETYYFKRI